MFNGTNLNAKKKIKARSYNRSEQARKRKKENGKFV
jgi:hypothetical protein